MARASLSPFTEWADKRHIGDNGTPPGKAEPKRVRGAKRGSIVQVGIDLRELSCVKSQFI
ncbi:MAG: hypothetical protein FWD71_13880 [Oscillospiraceae bacterium]|nr:hypothetical protein [Oscillospiraceae bacterium]